MKTKLLYAAAALFFVSAYGFVGNMDYEDEQRQEQHYCEMVAAGHWPAFNENINCEGE